MQPPGATSKLLFFLRVIPLTEYSDIVSDIPDGGIYWPFLSYILPAIYSDIRSSILSGIYSDIITFWRGVHMLTVFLAFYLASLPRFFLSGNWHSL